MVSGKKKFKKPSIYANLIYFFSLNTKEVMDKQNGCEDEIDADGIPGETLLQDRRSRFGIAEGREIY
jgi:hypothetical protein